MNALSISLLAILLLMLGGCGDKAAENKAESTAPAAQAKELSLEEKFAATEKKAEAGNAEAQSALGEMYVNGKGVPRDAAKAVEWYQKAAAQGNADAQFSLGKSYATGEGVPKDTAKAMEWLQKAAAQGNADAQFSLGEMHYFGKGVPRDAAKAVEWYQKAAAQGNADAQLSLAMNHDFGQGVPRNAAKAVEWYQKAAAQGNELAQHNLAASYARGEGVPRDYAKAVEWWQKAAAQGNEPAQLSLGESYADGKGVSIDMVLAYAWTNLAASSGNKFAVTNRNLYEARLSSAEKSEAQRLSSNWKMGQILVRAGGSATASAGTASPSGKLTKQGSGTAFAVSSEGHALTNHHIINGCAEVKVAGREGIAKVITSDSVNDLALLQLPGTTKDIASLKPDPGKLRQGEDVIVFGYPLNFVLSSGGNLTSGTLSALFGLGNNTNQIQITAPIQPGSSGSPVMDKKGNIVGVVSIKLDDMKMAKATGSVGQNVSFAINGQTVKAFLDTNKVPYKTGGGLLSFEKSNADIAEKASKWTVLVECWK